MKLTALLTLALAAVAIATPMPAKNSKTNPNSIANTKNSNNGKGTASGTKGTTTAAGGKTNGNVSLAANAQQVQNSVNQWLQDIKAVNTFVDGALALKSNQQISAAAKTAFAAAQDEGVQNDNLAASVKLDSLGQLANKGLASQFGIIGPAINDTISNPQNLKKNLDAINKARCPPPFGDGAILQEFAVQQAAALAVGGQVTVPDVPAACNQQAGQ